MSNADIVTPFRLIQQTCRLVTVRPGSSQRRTVAPPGQLRTFLSMNPTKTETQPLRDDRDAWADRSAASWVAASADAGVRHLGPESTGLDQPGSLVSADGLTVGAWQDELGAFAAGKSANAVAAAPASGRAVRLHRYRRAQILR